MKIFLSFVFVVFAACFFAGCTASPPVHKNEAQNVRRVNTAEKNEEPKTSVSVNPEKIKIDLGDTEKILASEAAKLKGTEINFQKDGLTFTDKHGRQLELMNKWPENEYTEKIPKPDFGVLSFAGIADGKFSATFAKTDIEDAKKYVEALKKKGFDKKITLNEFSEQNLYIFTASSLSGAKISVVLKDETFTLLTELLPEDSMQALKSEENKADKRGSN